MDAGGRPRRRPGWALQLADGWSSSCPPRQDICWIASLCSCATRNCWAMLPVASPKRPVWDTGTLRNRTLSASLCQPDTARGGAPGPQVWTSHDPRPCHNLRQSWREVRCCTELFQNFRIVTTPVHVPQCF